MPFKKIDPNKKLIVICEKCHKHYGLTLSSTKKVQDLIIYFARCPQCKHLRDSARWGYKDIISDLCQGCGVPFSRIPKHGKWCITCYFRNRRAENVADKE